MTAIYLAGASAEIDTCKRCMRALREAGHVVTFDWTAAISERATAGLSDRDLTPEERRMFAGLDLKGVTDADLIWVLAPQPPNASTGCWAELGYALALGPYIVVSGSWQRCIFTDLADQCFDDHDAALAWIIQAGKEATA
jgi:nucleoside 2-deoxyribosyltransferase